MASVYRGRDLRLNREVAVKVLRDDLTRDPEFLRRFEQEAQFVASLSHPNIVSVYDVGEEQGTHFIVMEYVQGRTVKSVIETEGRLSQHRAVAIMLPVLDALGYAHARGLIHRDVKPHNILLTPDGTPRLADFGIARLIDGSTTRTAAILGSAHYLSPEQARGEEARPQSDIYACGVVLYEMLTGHPPFDGANALAIANQHLHTPPAPLRDSGAVAAPVETAVIKALAKDPDDRFEDTASFAATLEQCKGSSEETSLAPLPGKERATEGPWIKPVHQVRDTRVVIRRSTRKTYLLAAFLLVMLFGITYAAGLPVFATRLPNYPSLPYMLLPAVMAAVAALSWINARSWIYSLDTNAAVVQWGLVQHHRFGIPLHEIVTLELKQSLIDRLLGVGTVDLRARDPQGAERRLVMEDLPHPRQTYEELMELLGRAARTRLAGDNAGQS